MRTRYYTMIAATLLLGCAAQANDYFTGASFDIAIVRDGIQVDLLRCITFHDGGRFSLDFEPLTMQWSPMAHYPSVFLAVTSPGHRTVVPYHLALFGKALADRTLTGTGVYQDGSTFVFSGYRRERCPVEPQRAGVTVAARRPGVAKDASLEPQALRIEDALQRLMSPGLDPCWTPPGHYVPCDPPIDPLRSGAGPTNRNQVENGSFMLTVGTSDGNVSEHCWTFGRNRAVAGAGLHKVTWQPDPTDHGGRHFVAVGGGLRGQGIAYRGVLLGSNLLHVAGIEAFNGQSTVTEGYGQRVRDCSGR